MNIYCNMNISGTYTEKICFDWIKDTLTDNSTSLAEMNALFTRRHIGGIIFISFVMVFGFFGNLAVILIFSLRFNHSSYRTYTLWLAIIDIINCILGLPFLLVYLTHYIEFPSTYYCKFGRFVLVLTTNISAFILIVIAKDRYYCVSNPFRNYSTKHIGLIPCILCIVCGVFVSWPSLILFGNHTMDTLPLNIKGNRCWLADEYKGKCLLSTFYIVLSVLSFIVTISLVIAYSLILGKLFKEGGLFQRLNTSSMTSERPQRTRVNRKTTMTLVAVTFSYLLSVVPHNVLVVILLLKKDLQCYARFDEGMLIYIFAWSVLFNNALNPVIYGFSDQRFRKELKKIFRRHSGLTNNPVNDIFHSVQS